MSQSSSLTTATGNPRVMGMSDESLPSAPVSTHHCPDPDCDVPSAGSGLCCHLCYYIQAVSPPHPGPSLWGPRHCLLFALVSKYKKNAHVPIYTWSLTGTEQDVEEAEVQHLCPGAPGGLSYPSHVPLLLQPLCSALNLDT